MAGGQPGQGTVLGGRYRLDELIGSGGMAQVWRATDLNLERRVAVKLSLALTQVADKPRSAERFRREARHTARLSHPNIVSLIDWVVEGDRAFIVMELVDGPSLRARLFRTRRLSVHETLQIAEQLLAALQYAHEHDIVHRDIKPENILIVRLDYRDEFIKLSDFGISKALAAGEAQLTRPGALGTPTYLAPELFADGIPSAASDLYSVGCVLYECLVGRPPFVGGPLNVTRKHQHAPRPTVRSQRPDVPEPFSALIRRSMDISPRLRPTSAGEMLAEVRRLLGGPSSMTERSPSIDTSTSTTPLIASELAKTTLVGPHRRRRQLIAFGVVILIIGGIIGGLLFTKPQGHAMRRETIPTTHPATRSSGGPTATLPLPANVTVMVANGSSIEGAATSWTLELRGLGFATLNPENAITPTRERLTTEMTSEVYAMSGSDLSGAQEVAADLHLPASSVQSSVMPPVASSEGAQVVVVVGADYVTYGSTTTSTAVH